MALWGRNVPFFEFQVAQRNSDPKCKRLLLLCDEIANYINRKGECGIVLPHHVSMIHRELLQNEISCVKYYGQVSEEVKSVSSGVFSKNFWWGPLIFIGVAHPVLEEFWFVYLPCTLVENYNSMPIFLHSDYAKYKTLDLL